MSLREETKRFSRSSRSRSPVNSVSTETCTVSTYDVLMYADPKAAHASSLPNQMLLTHERWMERDPSPVHVTIRPQNNDFSLYKINKVICKKTKDTLKSSFIADRENQTLYVVNLNLSQFSIEFFQYDWPILKRRVENPLQVLELMDKTLYSGCYVDKLALTLNCFNQSLLTREEAVPMIVDCMAHDLSYVFLHRDLDCQSKDVVLMLVSRLTLFWSGLLALPDAKERQQQLSQQLVYGTCTQQQPSHNSSEMYPRHLWELSTDTREELKTIVLPAWYSSVRASPYDDAVEMMIESLIGLTKESVLYNNKELPVQEATAAWVLFCCCVVDAYRVCVRVCLELKQELKETSRPFLQQHSEQWLGIWIGLGLETGSGACGHTSDRLLRRILQLRGPKCARRVMEMAYKHVVARRYWLKQSFTSLVWLVILWEQGGDIVLSEKDQDRYRNKDVLYTFSQKMDTTKFLLDPTVLDPKDTKQ